MTAVSDISLRPPKHLAADPDRGGGIWALRNGELVSLAQAGAGEAIVLVPSEHVLLMTVDLPLPSRRARLAALPFAVEDQLADPVGDVHFALGSELAPRRHLAAAVRHRAMADWIARLATLPQARLVPDCLALPVPNEGGWSVQAHDGRALVRTADGAGFAAPVDHLLALWAAAGQPAVTNLGEPLPPGLPAVDAEVALEPLTDRLLVPAVDLRQGTYAPLRRREPSIFLKAAAVLAAGTAAHAAVALADTVALQDIAEARQAEAAELASRYAPGAPLTPALAAEIGALLAGAPQQPRSPFFPALARVVPAAGNGALAGLSWSEADGALTVQFEARDPAALGRAQGQLAATGLPVAPGSSPDQLVIRGLGR